MDATGKSRGIDSSENTVQSYVADELLFCMNLLRQSSPFE